MKKIIVSAAASVLLAVAMCLSFCSCAVPVNANEISSDYSRRVGAAGNACESFYAPLSDFSFALLGRALDADGGNTLVSPFSVAMCLGMLANGTGGETRAQLEAMFGTDTDTLNKSMCTLYDRLCGDAFRSANSMWLREGLSVKPDFLQTNADYYGADVFSTVFDEAAIRDINRWTEKKTGGMIKELIERLDPETFAVLVNAVCFESEWMSEYSMNDISDGVFRNCDGSESKVKMLSSAEYGYIASRGFEGFAKEYKPADGGAEFSFVGLLPKDDRVDIFDFVRSLDGIAWSEAWGARGEKADVKIPEFGFDYSLELNDALKAMGVTDIFDYEKADFSGIADMEMACSRVIHKTHIEVDRNGTRAAAATAAVVDGESAGPTRRVVLDRPFVFMIVDNASGIPLFAGVVTNIR